MEYEKRERLNTLVRGKTFPELHISYVCFSEPKTIFLKTLIHELYHHQDLFICSEDNYIAPMEEGVYVDTRGYIKNLISAHLNDFFAEYNTIKKLIDLKNTNNVKKINLLLAVKYNLGFLTNIEQYTREQIQGVNNKEILDFEKYILVIYCIQHYLVKSLCYYLATYRAIQEAGYSNQLYEDRLNQFILDEIRPTMSNLVREIKNILLTFDISLIEQASEIRDTLNDLLLNFYENDYENYLSELFET